MKHHVLQNMVVSPRDSSYDPRIAQTGTTKRNVGADGMLYANVSGSNDQKYKIMSESELMDEMRRSQEIKEAMIGSGKQSRSRQTRPHSASVTGTTVRSPVYKEMKRTYSRSPVSNNSLQRNKEADDTDYYSARLPGYSEASGEFSREGQMRRGRSFRSTADNQGNLRHSEHDMMRSSERGIASERNRNHDSRTNMSTARYEIENENEEEEIPHANSMIDSLKLKYEQNLDVIERLFDEKSSMEKLVRSLDSQLSMAKKELASPKYSDRVVYGASSSGNFSDTREENLDILRRGNHLEEDDDNAMRDYDLEFSRSSRPVPGDRTYNSLPPRDPSRSLSVARMSREYLEEESRRSRDAYQGDVTYDLMSSTAGGMARPSSAFSRHSDSHQAWNSSCHIRDQYPFYSLESKERSPSPSPRGRDRDWERERARSRGSDRDSYRDRNSNSSRGRERSSTPTSSYAYSMRNKDRRSLDDCDVENLGPRSRSHSRSFSTEPRLSTNLQADQDRYVQRRRAFEDREKERIADQKKFEESLIDRSVRASRNGGEFTEMIKRDALAREKVELKRKEKEEKEAREAIEVEEAKNKQRKILLERSRPKEEMTWAEMQEVQERMREERIALRVVEMSSRIGFEPSKSSEGIARQTARSKLSPAPDAPVPVEDPKAVLTRLEKQRRDWDRKLDRIRTLDLHSRNEANKEVKQKTSQMGTTAALGDKLFHGTASMVQRAVEFEEKKINKLNEKIKKELDAKEKKLELEKKQREKIINSKVPEEGRRLTKSVEIRANMVRGSLLEKEAAKAKETARLNKKKLAEKQHGEVLRTLLLERERDRKMNHGGFVELNKSQAEIDAIAAENRERFRTRLRENRRKIEMAAEARPSLLIRHDQAVARSMAATSALQKVAQAVVGGKLSGGQRAGSKSEQAAVRSALNEDDIFDENQKILLGYQDDFLDN